MVEEINLDLEKGRDIPVNWEHQLKNIKDQYRKEKGVVHGVQKDAVQNGWDARANDFEKKWGFTIQLHTGQPGTFPTFVTMTDEGTYGLTGSVLTREEMEDELPVEERWARFQSSFFSKSEEEGAIGARGQGKFIFIGASKKHRIYYDTFRSDETYRIGIHGVVSKTKCVIDQWDGEEGLRKINERFPTLSPLTKVGTRIIIVDPIDELIDAINDGSFIEMISETWWEIIQKFGASIRVISDKGETSAKVPDFLAELPKNDTKEVKFWYRENDKFEISGTSFRIKRLHIAWKEPDDVPSDEKGIVIQRRCMNVCTFNTFNIPRNISDGLYGYIQFDDELDRLMSAAESVTHYGFDWRRSGASQVRGYIREQVSKFAYEKLEFGVDPEIRRTRERREVEKRALSIANQVAKILGIDSLGRGSKGKGKRKGVKGKKDKHPIRLDLGELNLPNENLRVNYGETVENIKVSVINETDQDIKSQLKMWLFSAEDGHIIEEFVPATDFVLKKNSIKGPFGPFALRLENGDYLPGHYKIRTRLICMDNYPEYDKGDILAERTKSFFLEIDPPERFSGMWEDIVGVELDQERLGVYSVGEYGGYVYKYNLKHKAYEAIGDDEEAIVEYLFRLTNQAIIEIDLQSDTSVLFDEEELGDPVILAEKMGSLKGVWLNDYYSSE